MESWRKVWQDGIVPLVSIEDLESLQKALEKDDSRLIQGGTTLPPPLACVQDWPVEKACAISWLGWHGGDVLTTIGEVEEFFARMCYEIDQRLGEQGGCRHFLNWFDETPRDEMRRLLLEEVSQALIRLKSASS